MDYILGFCFCYTDPTQSNQISSSSLLSTLESSSVDFMTVNKPMYIPNFLLACSAFTFSFPF